MPITAEKISDALDRFARKHPVEAEWINRNSKSFDFARSMMEGVVRFGGLTPNQIGAIQRCLEREKEAKDKPQGAEVSIEKVEQAFAAARARGIQKPKIRLEHFLFKPAGVNTKNPGAIYVTTKSRNPDQDGQYLGKIMGGKFFASRECTPEQQSSIVASASNPEAAAKAYGLRTGECSICGHKLSKSESIGLGIGPICRTRMGWA